MSAGMQRFFQTERKVSVFCLCFSVMIAKNTAENLPKGKGEHKKMKNRSLKWMKLTVFVAATAVILNGCGSASQSVSDEMTVDATADVQDEESVDEDAQQDDVASLDETEEAGDEETVEESDVVYNEELSTEEDPDIDWEANDKSAQPAEWYELQQDGYELVLKLEDPADDDFQWILQNHYEDVISVESEANEDGCYILTMDAALDKAGTAQIALQYTDAWDENVQETVVMDLFVNESGELSVETASRM